jgi:hypothetical protein
MNLHTPSEFTLGVRVSMDSRIFKEQLQGSKTHLIEKLFISLESFWNINVKMG